MTKIEAIEKLDALVSRIPDLQKQKSFSEDFEKWKHDSRAVLKYVFPKERQYVKDFDEISYSLSFASSSTPDSEWEVAFRSGLGSARAMLLSRIDEVRQFWPDEERRGPASVTALSQTINDIAGSSGPDDKVFVIHGRQLLGEFHTFLRALGLKPLEWSNARTLTGRPNPYTWEIVDTALRKASAIVALLTPDDEARLQPHLCSEHDSALEKEYLSQPRQNVLFEAGVAYGRKPERTVLVRVGSHRPMSDLAGHYIVQLDDSVQTRQAVANALRAAGCNVNTSGSDWFQAGGFSLTQPSNAAQKTGATKRDMGTLYLYKTQIKGFSDLITAASVVGGIHSFFASRPDYLNGDNAAFLEKYPLDFREQLEGNATREAINRWSLEGLKRDVDLLRIDLD